MRLQVWSIEEDLAGSIDFVGIYTRGEFAGQLFLGDWKRSKDLRNKKKHRFGTKMLEPLGELHDAACVHYCLQLNCYKFLIEKHYGFKVARMEVICCHEDNRELPFFFQVPELPEVVEFMMAHQRLDCASKIITTRTAFLQANPSIAAQLAGAAEIAQGCRRHIEANPQLVSVGDISGVWGEAD